MCDNLPGATAVWLTARSGNALVGGMAAVCYRHGPLGRLVSHYDGTSGGPVITSALAPDQREQLFTDLVECYAGIRHGSVQEATLSLTAGQEQDYSHLLQGTGWRRQEVPAAVMPLEGGLDYVERHVLKKNRRNERNRALKRGCSYGVTSDLDLLSTYYPIYEASAHRWGITPVPLGLLRDVLKGGEEHAFLTYVRCEDEIVGAHLNFHWGDRVTAWNGATLPAHDDKFPATLLIWADLEEACRRGAAWLDLGGSGGLASLANFKKLLGAQEEVRGHYVLESTLMRVWRRGRDLMRTLGGHS